MSLIKDYFEKTKTHISEFGELTIVLIQVGAFFEVYGLKDNRDNIVGSNIMEFSRICDLNVVDKRVCCGSQAVVMAGFKDHLIDKYVKKLQDSGYTIAVYEQDEQCANTTRSLTGIYSPGTYFSTDTENITNNTCCIWVENKKGTLKNKDKMYVYIGASVVDIFTGTTSIMEYKEQYIKNPTTFDELEKFISIYNPSETILISNLPVSEINDIVSYANIKGKSLHIINLNDHINGIKNIQRVSNCEKQTYQIELLNKFYKINDITSFMGIFNDNVYATQSFCYLLDFIYQHNPNLIYKISEPILENDSKKLILANHSLKQLNIIEDDNYKGKYASVVKMLNECITPMGKRKFTYNFLNPVTNETYLQEEYDITESLLNDNYSEKYTFIKSMLVQIKDISKILRQIMLQKITPKTIYQLYTTMCSAKLVYEFVLSKKYLNDYLKKKMVNFVSCPEEIERILTYLQTMLILEECKDIENIQKIEKSFIQNGVDIELDNKIRTLIDSQDQLEACKTYFSNIILNYETGTKGIKGTKSKKNVKVINENNEDDEDDEDDEDIKSYVKIHETGKNNFSLLATDRRCKILEEIIKDKKSVVLKYKSSLKNIETNFTLSLGLEYNKQSASNKTITNSQISLLCKNVGNIKVNLIDTVSKVYKGIVQKLQDYQNEINNINEFITYVDIVYTKALIADKYNYCKPQIEPLNNESDKSFIQTKDLRHCLIEKIQQTELYVANDITIGLGKLDGILLYGTNAVGKTSFIRALGISVIMAQSGLYVPATSYKFRPYKYIFTRILGNDNLFKGLSTFAVEMSELRTILRLSDKNSLVLGDELCSGTESISAVSIFVAGVQNLAAKGCSFIFATHLHEIISYDEITTLHNVGMKHMSVIYDREKDCLIYNRKLEDGPGNNMYGLEVCKSLSLPQDFLENAHNIRMKYHPESASVLQQKGSHFNTKHISGGICENCKKEKAVDVHHLIFQNEANDKGIIKKEGLTFNKNNKANLLNLCEKCHDEIHKTNKKFKKTKTTIGKILEEI
jgi:DNA mismatch repair protein MutS